MALISSLMDNFNTNILNTALWSNWGGANVVNTNQHIEITTNTNSAGAYFGMDSVSNYDLTNSAAIIQIVSAGNQSIVSHDCIFYIQKADLSGDDEVMFFIENGTLFFRRRSATINSDTSIPYNSTLHKWLRITDQSGTIYMDTSPDGKSWTNQRSFSNPFTDITNIRLSISTGTFASETLTSTDMFDNVNIYPITGSKTLLGIGQL